MRGFQVRLGSLPLAVTSWLWALVCLGTTSLLSGRELQQACLPSSLGMEHYTVKTLTPKDRIRLETKLGSVPETQ